MAYSFKPNHTYSFEVYPTAVLGNDFQNVVVEAVMGFRAALMSMDVMAVQATVFAALPAGTPNRPEDYEYIMIKTVSGQTTVLACQWINEDTIKSITNSKVVVVIEGAGSSDLEDIRAALDQNGYSKLDLRVVV